jgi:hypothetical protein
MNLFSKLPVREFAPNCCMIFQLLGSLQDVIAEANVDPAAEHSFYF